MKPIEIPNCDKLSKPRDPLLDPQPGDRVKAGKGEYGIVTVSYRRGDQVGFVLFGGQRSERSIDTWIDWCSRNKAVEVKE